MTIFSFYGGYSAEIVCIWFSFWIIRRQSDADYPLDITAKIARWLIVCIGFVAAYYIPGSNRGNLRVVSAFVGLAFLCWPNLAYHLTNVFRGKNAATIDSGNIEDEF